MLTEAEIKTAVIGAGAFGRNHLRVLSSLAGTRLVACVDAEYARAEAAAAEFGCRAIASLDELIGAVDAVVIATPTSTHAEIASQFLENGVDVLVEKPIAATRAEAASLVELAARNRRVLQVGHLERFNPAVEALEAARKSPLFFEVHRLSIFTPRSLDVDVVLDLMIHDLEILLALTRSAPIEIRAAGIQILSQKVDIANVRLEFPGGCIANLTASRASTEKVRKLRMFQPNEYLSVDYSRQDLLKIAVGPERQIQFQPVAIEKAEPLRRELDEFLDCVRTRRRPRVSGVEGARALELALDILDKIEEHAQLVARSLGHE